MIGYYFLKNPTVGKVISNYFKLPKYDKEIVICVIFENSQRKQLRSLYENNYLIIQNSVIRFGQLFQLELNVDQNCFSKMNAKRIY